MYIFVCVVPVLGSVPPSVFSLRWVLCPFLSVGLCGVLPVRCLACRSRLSCLRVACRSCACRSVGGVVACLGLPVASSCSFVPSASSVSLPGGCSAVVPVPSALGASGGVVSGSAWVVRSGGVWVSAPPASASALAVRFVGVGVPLVCLRAALPASGAFARLGAAVAAAGLSGSAVFPVVGVGASGVAASGFFCGLSASGPVAPVPCAVSAGSFAS